MIFEKPYSLLHGNDISDEITGYLLDAFRVFSRLLSRYDKL